MEQTPIEKLKDIAIERLQKIKAGSFPRNTRNKMETQAWLAFTGCVRKLGCSEAEIDSHWVDVRSKIV